MAKEQRLDDRVDPASLLLEQLAHVVERLQQGWPDAALHAGAHDPVDPGQEAPEERGRDDEEDAVDERVHARTTIPTTTIAARMAPHRITPARNTSAPSMTPSR